MAKVQGGEPDKILDTPERLGWHLNDDFSTVYVRSKNKTALEHDTVADKNAGFTAVL